MCISVSMFYGYQQLRRMAKMKYPNSRTLSNPESISDSISLEKLYEVRCQNDFEASYGYKYATLGSEKMVDNWVTHGINKGLLSGFWRCDIEELVKMERSPANERLMQQLYMDNC